MQTRRDFLSFSAKAALLAVGADLGLPGLLAAAQDGNAAFTSALPVPGASGLLGLFAPEGRFEMTAGEAAGALPATGAGMLAYAVEHKGARYLNPVLVLRKGQDFEATLVNRLREPTIIHWHGVDGPWKQAGHPSYAIAPGESYAYGFPVTNRAGTYWYHPHPHGLTAKQSYMGLASFFIVRDEAEDAFSSGLDLRLGETDIPVVLQDKRFTPDGRLLYSPDDEELFMGYLGGTVLANGAHMPTLKTATRLYRFRLLNGSTARIFNLAFTVGGMPMPFVLVGNDGGFLPAPQTLTEVFLAPGERVDVLVDLRALSPGQEVVVRNMPFDPMHNEMAGMSHGGGRGAAGSTAMEGGHGGMSAPGAMHGEGRQMGSGAGHGTGADGMGHGTGSRMAGGAHGGATSGILGEGDAYPVFRLLVDRKVPYDRKVPAALPSIAPAVAGGTERPIALAMRHPRGWTINGLVYSMKDSPIVVPRRAQEVWAIRNAVDSMPHPMHLHGYFYRVLERRASPAQVRKRAVDAKGRLATDLGYKDTVLVWPGETVYVGIDFGSPDYPGEQLFLFHCHNLEHEDQGMMLNVRVV